MHGMRRRLWLPLCLMAALAMTLIASAQGNGSRVLEIGTEVTGILDEDNAAQVYSFEGAEGDTLAVTASGSEPLVVLVTDSTGEPLAQAVERNFVNSSGIVLDSIVLPADGTYYITVFRVIGAGLTGSATFTLVVDELPEAGTPSSDATPTVAPTVVTEAPETTEAATTETPLESGQVVTTSGIQVTLSWETIDDLDLEVRDPVGGSLYWETPTVPSGGTIGPSVNQGCANTTDAPSETATWSPGGVPTGSYEVLIYYQQACAGENAVSFTVAPVVDGNALDTIEGSLLPGEVYIASFEVNADGSASLNPLSGVVDLNALPASAGQITASATPITIGETVSGTITNEDPYQAYSFTANANDLVTVSMNAQSGSLDPFLALIDANGNTIRFNDDVATGVTDAGLSNVLLPTAGTYTVIATRYGKELGGTEGTYTLTLLTQATDLSEEFANLPLGSLEIRLLWFDNTAADVQLLVRDPSGDSVYDDVPQIRSGGQLAAAGNVGCRVSDGTPFSYIYWPENAPPRPGSYEVEVWFQSDCGNTTAPVRANLYITYNGQEVFSQSNITPQLNERFLTSFTIGADGTAQAGPGGIIRGVEDLNYVSELENAIPIESDAPVNGSITPENKFDLYTFTAAAGDVVSIGMNNTSGTLDTFLYLVGPSGSVVGQNDDAVAGENTNSQIANLTLPESGQYIIIATHFGGLYGGTTGTYQLTYSQLN
ncbi:MAG TPA: PPC domain-containing protein [Oceanobacillus sp.]|nr:PPC domain-containing protein [Oceanobacillus sp.]